MEVINPDTNTVDDDIPDTNTPQAYLYGPASGGVYVTSLNGWLPDTGDGTVTVINPD